ncbi:MAG: hypothetical protein JOS17DRAFT_847079 [Linnemannia elongata]|nr:MAG: hypothetical protein JOS17DRAFT_847079 [Linnemannia elongata]
MAMPGQFPPEILSVIFRYLAPQDLSRRLRVSRLWHAKAEPQLSRNMVLEPGMILSQQLLAAYSRKHLIRRVEFTSSSGDTVHLSDILDFLLDFRQHPKHHMFNDDVARASKSSKRKATIPFPIPLGLNRPTLKHFSHKGYHQSWRLFDAILYSLTALVSLDLDFISDCHLPCANNVVDLDRILTGFPRLKHLGIIGTMVEYVPSMAAGHGGRAVPFHELAAGDLTTPVSSGTSSTIPKNVVTRTIHRWACEETLQTLIFGVFVHPGRSKDIHAMVWKRLGRFQNLPSLTFPLSSLVPSPTHGLHSLLTGRGRLGETLTEIRSLPSWWEVEDRREMVLWFAKSFPNLVVLGLMHYREEVEGGKVEKFVEFLEDEDVKKCPIHRIFIEAT